ncbi:MAG: hypothetical protein Q9M36_09425 [Sulfurovum sp.]|nr:hypothetical protein [Sulfurovum sp.]
MPEQTDTPDDTVPEEAIYYDQRSVALRTTQSLIFCARTQQDVYAWLTSARLQRDTNCLSCGKKQEKSRCIGLHF